MKEKYVQNTEYTSNYALIYGIDTVITEHVIKEIKFECFVVAR